MGSSHAYEDAKACSTGGLAPSSVNRGFGIGSYRDVKPISPIAFAFLNSRSPLRLWTARVRGNSRC